MAGQADQQIVRGRQSRTREWITALRQQSAAPVAPAVDRRHEIVNAGEERGNLLGARCHGRRIEDLARRRTLLSKPARSPRTGCRRPVHTNTHRRQRQTTPAAAHARGAR
jgi:hypothetical protein